LQEILVSSALSSLALPQWSTVYDRCDGYEDEGKQMNRLQNTKSDTRLVCKRVYRWSDGNADASTASFFTLFFPLKGHFFDR
jgi:hypothetical protein